MPTLNNARTGHFHVDFTSTKFDISREPPNDINPTAGQSFLVWLKPLLERAGYAVDPPRTEDWGWYIEVNDPNGRRFIVGASAMPYEGDQIDWYVQVWRWRTLRQWLRREPVMDRDEPLLRFIERTLDTPDFVEVDVSEQPPPMGFWESFRRKRPR
jgi:hypothetical protein